MFFKQGYFPFKDHEAPPLNIVLPFCQDAAKFLNSDPKNVIAIHCLAGKGRTGTLISCLLLYMKQFTTATACLKYYGLMRVENGRGVTVPSQIRYVYYFDSVMKNNIAYPIEFNVVYITKIKMITVPPFSTIGSYCCPTFTIENGDLSFKWSDRNKNKDGFPDITPSVDFELSERFEVKGDVKIQFEHMHSLGRELMCKLWFNTIFVPESGKLVFRKNSAGGRGRRSGRPDATAIKSLALTELLAELLELRAGHATVGARGRDNLPGVGLLLGGNGVLSAGATVDEGPGDQTWVPPVAEVSGTLPAGEDV